ncbi:hypothetical protein ACHHYP_00187 [Achlya hypogyna]|uniref:Uncharacterized protein n=1 Tax=Achlya hypogyna TaxID=1202772 RepID=A0A1V9ZBA4_ACHHY|nr:hypothetical protein ACHHYP_00187 [Achlya hypogyna]
MRSKADVIDLVDVAIVKYTALRTRVVAAPKLYGLLFLIVVSAVLYQRDVSATYYLTLERYPVRSASCEYLSPAFEAQIDALAAQPRPLVLSREHTGVFRGADEPQTRASSWKDCLPMHTQECGVRAGAANSIFTHPTNERKCRAAVLHHMLSTSTLVLERLGYLAVPVGTALHHIWEYGALPPNTHSIHMATDAIEDLSEYLWAEGFAHFKDPHLGPVTCIAPHHVLAAVLYSPELPLVMGPDTGVPYLHWSTLTPAKSALGLADEASYLLAGVPEAFDRQKLFPLSCLPLYDAAVQTPHFPAAFFDVPASAPGSQAPAYAYSYPSTSCEAHCTEDGALVKKTVTPNVPRCKIYDDKSFNAKVKEYAARKVPLELSYWHQEVLAPFTNNVTRLRAGKDWTYCLPIVPQQCGEKTGSKASIFETPVGRPCRSAVLHLLMEEMLDALDAEDQVAFVYFGSLLGSWRDHAVIPHTPDTDIIVPSETDWDHLQDVLWKRGIYVFERGIHAACIASHHPLAPLLYAPSSSLTDSTDHGTPYLDLYMWSLVDDGKNVHVQTARDDLPVEMMFPLTCDARVFKSRVPGIQYPEGMFISEYGMSYVKDTKLLFNKCESYCEKIVHY